MCINSMKNSIGNTKILRLLIANDIYVNQKNHDGLTALQVASNKGYTIIAKILIENGADIKLKDKTGSTALHTAVTKGKQNTYKFGLDKQFNLFFFNQVSFKLLSCY